MNSKWYQSSNGSGNISLTLKGAVLAIVPVAIMIAQSQGYAVEENLVMEAIESGFAVVASIMVFVGVVRKIYYAVGN